MNFLYQGLRIEVEFSREYAATWEQPAEGGDIESLEWEVEDPEEVLGWLEVGDEEEWEDAMEYFQNTGTLPLPLCRRIEAEWDLHTPAYEQ